MLQVVEHAVHLIEHSFFILVLHAELVAVGLADAAALVRPRVPDVGGEVVDVVALFLPDPQKLVHELSSHIWDAWADESGSIGKAYGYQLGVKHQYKEGMFDQVDRVLYDLKHDPASRRILTNLYNFADLHEMALYPCAYSMTFNVSGDTLNAILNQRSQDMLAANNWNVVQYAVLVHMMAQVSGLKAGELVHVIADAHIYDRHVPIIEQMLSEPEKPAPAFFIDPSVTDFYAFTKDSFRLEGYEPCPFEAKIPIAV